MRVIHRGKLVLPDDDSTDGGTDPRLTGDYVRQVPAAGNSVTLVGVVHDHPASTHRVRRTVEGIDPAVLAVELPPLAVPLFEHHAADLTPPASGGEMSVAIRAAGSAQVVGIDGPTPGFLLRLGRNLCAERAEADTVRRVLQSVVSITKHAVVCRLAGTLTAHTDRRIAVGSPNTHEVSDDPDEQAADERDQIRRAKSITSVFEPSKAVQFRNETRDEYMASRLAGLSGEGDVVAVVGIDHLDGVADRLAAVTRETE